MMKEKEEASLVKATKHKGEMQVLVPCSRAYVNIRSAVRIRASVHV